MEQSEKIMKKHERKMKKAKASLKKAEFELNRAIDSKNLASHVIGNIEWLRDMSDSDVRRYNLPRILALDCNKTLLEFYAHPGDIIHYDVSERFDALRDWLVKKHDSIYDVENLGEMGSMSARHLKKGHSESEFNDTVWDTLKDWIHLYNDRQMNEELYQAVMKDDFESLYDRLIK